MVLISFPLIASSMMVPSTPISYVVFELMALIVAECFTYAFREVTILVCFNIFQDLIDRY